MEDVKFGALPSPKDDRDYKAKDHICKGIRPEKYIPEEYAPILNQGSVNSCVAHSLATMKWYQEHRERRSYDEYSTDFIYHNRAENEWQGLGMFTRDACKHLVNEGVALKKNISTNTEYPNSDVKKLIDKYRNEAMNYDGEKYVSLDTADNICEAIFQYSACVICIEVKSSFSSFYFKDENNMVLPIPKSSERDLGYHAICAVGYNEKGIIVQNSWGEAWGHNGLAILPYDYPIRESWVVVDKVKRWDIIEMKIGSKKYKRNDVEYETDVAPKIIENRTMVPLRLIAELLDADVEWNERTRKIVIRRSF